VSTQGARDEFERWLSVPGLYDLQESAGPGCPSAETMAAFAEHALDAGERARWEAHVSECARCQQVLAAMVRSADAAPAAPPRELDATRRRWLWWVAPAGLAAAAAVAWVVVRPVAPPVATPAQLELAAARQEDRAPQPPPAGLPSSRDAASPSGGVAPGVVARDERSIPRLTSKAQPSEAEADAPTVVAKREPVEEPAQKAQAARAEEQRMALREQAQAIAEAARSAGSPPGAAPPTAPPAAIAETTAPTAYRQAAAEPAAAPGRQTAKVAADEPAPGADVGRNEARRVAARGVVFTAPIEVATPGSDVRWRLGAQGLVQRRDDPQSPWRTLFEDATLQWVAGASPSPDVCWIATRGGEVLVTRDGRSWGRHRVADPDDLVGIAAADGRAATVTLRSGLRLRTVDGGANWLPTQ
jgi:hypothetical protein